MNKVKKFWEKFFELTQMEELLVTDHSLEEVRITLSEQYEDLEKLRQQTWKEMMVENLKE